MGQNQIIMQNLGQYKGCKIYKHNTKYNAKYVTKPNKYAKSRTMQSMQTL